MAEHRERVRILRERKGLRQDQLAQLCSDIDQSGAWPQSKISRIETGAMDLSVDDLAVIVEALGITMPQFFRVRVAA